MQGHHGGGRGNLSRYTINLPRIITDETSPEWFLSGGSKQATEFPVSAPNETVKTTHTLFFNRRSKITSQTEPELRSEIWAIAHLPTHLVKPPTPEQGSAMTDMLSEISQWLGRGPKHELVDAFKKLAAAMPNQVHRLTGKTRRLYCLEFNWCPGHVLRDAVRQWYLTSSHWPSINELTGVCHGIMEPKMDRQKKLRALNKLWRELGP